MGEAISIYDNTYEAHEENTPVILHQGKKIGYAVGINDADGTGKREGKLGSVYTTGELKDVAWFNTDSYGVIELLD